MMIVISIAASLEIICCLMLAFTNRADKNNSIVCWLAVIALMISLGA